MADVLPTKYSVEVSRIPYSDFKLREVAGHEEVSVGGYNSEENFNHDVDNENSHKSYANHRK